jgi:hypothetical protein
MKQRILEGLPIAGIIAFSGCSVNALAHWMLDWSRSKTPWYWVAALLVEGCTAWLVWSIVDTARTLTKSRISKQDKRFYKIILLLFVALAIPSISASVVANYVEFQGNPLLSVLFPVLTVASAVGAGLPDVVKRYKEGKKEDKEAAEVAKLRQQLAGLVQQGGQDGDIVPTLTNKADRLTWLTGQGDNLPDIADMVTAWGKSARTVRRYLSEVRDREETSGSLDATRL